MDTSTVVRMDAAVVTLVVVHWKRLRQPAMPLPCSFPSLAGWLSELVWAKINS